MRCPSVFFFFLFFFFNDTATTEIYTLSLHDALPISVPSAFAITRVRRGRPQAAYSNRKPRIVRSEEHTSELQSLAYLVCRLLLEKKKKKRTTPTTPITYINNKYKYDHIHTTLQQLYI